MVTGSSSPDAGRRRLHDVDVVVPTVGRPSLERLLRALAAGDVLPRRVLVIDDRPDRPDPAVSAAEHSLLRVTLLTSGGRGPAAARNRGWRASTATWVAFLDDDVLPPRDWCARLAADLADLPADVAGCQGRVRVPLPSDRPPTDWERNVAGLERARWATADLAYRRDVLAGVGGFDERFPRAYREDADLGLRITDAGHRIVQGDRWVRHPVRDADDSISIRLQAGNAEDPMMWALHGRGWRDRAAVPPGRRRWHVATSLAAVAASVAAAAGRRRIAATAALVWGGLVANFAWRRIAPGPRTSAEIRRMLWTSAVLPFAATGHWLRGWAQLPQRLRQPGPRAEPLADGRNRPAAVLFDRDGTLVHDVPYNGDPAAVAPVPTAREALTRLRSHGIPVAVVSNQSGLARGLLTPAQVAAVNDRIDTLLGPFDHWAVCPHGPGDGCRCRKPRPGLIEQAAAALGVEPRDCVVIGDIGSDVEAARAAGARPILVPTAITQDVEVAAAPEVAADLSAAVELALGGTVPHARRDVA